VESNWRWNVADQGFSGAGVRLLARDLSQPGRWLALFEKPTPRIRRVVVSVSPAGVLTMPVVGPFFRLPPFPPADVPVEPD